jgi:predicted NBD/HSP70 family sugar kinase
MTHCIFIGLDVHQNSIDVAIADGTLEGEVRYYGKINGELSDVDRLIRDWVTRSSGFASCMKQALVAMGFTGTCKPRGSIARWWPLRCPPGGPATG